ncbi:MAG: AMP-binding protein [Sedimenticola sp.]
MNGYSAYEDTFARDNLPPGDQWPDLINLDQLGYPDRLNCATELLDRAVDDGYGDKVCLHTPSENWTYSELLQHANRIAHVLTEELGMVSGERVLLRGANNAMMVACWFGLIKAGGIAVTTMPLLRAVELVTLIDKAKVRLAICDERLNEEMELAREEAADLERIVYFNGSRQLEGMMSKKSDRFENLETSADDICMIACTSGTTGQPKGTMHFHRDVLAICDTFSKDVLKPDESDIFIGSPPLAFTFGLGGLVLFPMRARASMVLLENGSPDKLAKAISEFGATVLFTAPTGYRFMLNTLGEGDLPSLKKCVSAGEPLPKPTWEEWERQTGIRIIDGIGATEMLHVFISAEGEDIRPGATGRPVTGYQAQVIDEDGNPLPAGEVGRLAVKGPTGCRYLDDDRQKGYVINGWNVTGDAYMMDEDGYFWFQSRTDDMIISAGYNIGGPEVEAALLAHDAVADCAVVGSPDEGRGQVVKAFVILREGVLGDDVLVKTLQNFVKEHIAPYKYPRRIEFVDELPRTQTGKVQRFRLRELEVERAGGV